MSLIQSHQKAVRRVLAQRRGNPAINIVARQLRGDPGLFDFVGKAIGGIAKALPGIGTALSVAEGVAGLISGNKGKPVNPAALGGTRFQSLLPASLAAPSGDTRIFSPGGDISVGGLPPMLADPGRGNVTQGGFSGGTDWNDSPNSLQRACQKGYHANKTGYWTKKYGYIPKGSNCVKNRRRNPLNPRAASRAMARLSSAKSASKFLGRISIRPSHGCGCK